MKKRLYLIFLPFLVSVAFYACDLGNNPNYNSEFEIDSLSLQVGTWIDVNTPYSGINPVNNTNDTIDFRDLAFEIHIEKVSYLTSSKPVGLFYSASADPEPPHSKSKVSLISIYSDHQINSPAGTFAAGTDVSSLFVAYRGWGDWKPILKMLENFDEWYFEEPVYLRLSTRITPVVEQQFTFKITMEDGKIFELKSPQLIIE